MGSHHPEEFRHHRGNAGEVMRSGFAFPSARERRHRHGRWNPSGYMARAVGSKQTSTPLAAQCTNRGQSGGDYLDKSSVWLNCVGFTKDTHDERITS